MTDDLSDLSMPHWSDGAAPRPGLHLRGATVEYDQATVVEWNPDTGENVIRYRGDDFPNVPMIGSTDILVTQPGDQVAVMTSTPAGGAGSMWITGRIVVPGTPEAARSIEFMTSAIAQEISAAVFAERIKSDADPDLATRNATTFGDPEVGSAGPAVTGVSIVSGTAIVIMGCNLKAASDETDGSVFSAGYVGFEISGATSVPATEPTSSMWSLVRKTGTITTDESIEILSTFTSVQRVTGLNPGLHDFSLKYRRLAGAGEPMECAARTLVVIGL
ncbi:hypothetical protein [Glycomyces paridis]|uniref:Uncharacterized protein n=1 Tax=Glycomyces paridis TaxID=2126555 RepID=A0A4S8PCK1_9ACTN|nr:hypothetical protein [Glycomyces paridis]THV26014.1 hypothetical protein E9998_19985 [Glycomyces paridis]